MQCLVLDLVRSYVFGILIVLLSIRGIGFVSYASPVSPQLQYPLESTKSGSGHGAPSGRDAEVTDDPLVEWFKTQSGGEVPISVSTSRDYKNASFVGDMLSAMQSKAKFVNSGPISGSNPGQRVPTVRMKRGIIAGMKRKQTERMRVIFKRKPKRGRIFSLAEIVLKAVAPGITDGDDIIAKVVSKRGKRKVKAKLAKDYLIFDISGLVDGKTRRVRLQYITYGKTSTSVKTRAYLPIEQTTEPLLVTYENLNENPLLGGNSHGRQARDIQGVIEEWTTPMPSDNRYPRGILCQRHDWTLDMYRFRFDWYFHPMSIGIGYCKGYCPIPLLARHLNTTNYSYIKHLYHAYTANSDTSVPRACCSPIEYESQSIYYLNTDLEDVIQVLPNMKVRRCGCR